MVTSPAAAAAGRPVLSARRFEPRLFLVLVLATTILATGCVAPTKSILTTEAQQPREGVSKVLVMPADIELSELTAGGLMEPNAAWTKTARFNVDKELAQTLAPYGAQIVRYGLLDEDEVYDPAHVQAVKLHDAVGVTILLHKYVAGLELPTKKDKFDWSLGDSVSGLRNTYDADYALFVYMRDSFASGGRVALIMFGALLGVGIPGGTQVGFASLVNLNSGDIVWFNRLARAEGDLREPKLAQEAVDHLLTEIPL